MLIIFITCGLVIMWMSKLLAETLIEKDKLSKELDELKADKIKLLEEINFLNKTIKGQRYAMYHLSIANQNVTEKGTDTFWDRYKNQELEDRLLDIELQIKGV